MPDYKETTGAGKSWRRSHHVTIYNPLPELGVRQIMYTEQDCLKVGERTATVSAPGGPGGLRGVFDAEALIPLRDPETGELTGGTVSQAVLYQGLYSHYMQLALARDQAEIDAANAEPPAPPTPDAPPLPVSP